MSRGGSSVACAFYLAVSFCTYPSCRTRPPLGLQVGHWPEVPGVIEVALTLIEAMAQHAGGLPPRKHLLFPVTGPGSWLPTDVWLLKIVMPIVMLHVTNDSLTDREAGFGSMAELRRKVIIAAAFRCAPHN